MSLERNGVCDCVLFGFCVEVEVEVDFEIGQCERP